MHIGKLVRPALEISGCLFAIGLITVACTATFSAPKPVLESTQRFDLAGLSILPPRGSNWYTASIPDPPNLPGRSLVYFLKKHSEQQPTRPAEVRVVYARVGILDLQDPRLRAPSAFDSPSAFLLWLKNDGQYLGQMVTAESRLVTFEVTLDDSHQATCARYNNTVERRGWQLLPQELFIMELRGLYCLHPHWPRYMIDVGYTQFYLKGEKPLRIEAELEPFLTTVVFNQDRPLQ